MPPRPPRRHVSNAPCVHILRPTTSRGDHTYEKQLLSHISRDDKCKKSGHHGHYREGSASGLHLGFTEAHFRHKNRGKCLKNSGGQGRNRTALCKRSQHPAYRDCSESCGVRIGVFLMPGDTANPKLVSPEPDQAGSAKTAVEGAARCARAAAVEILRRWGSLSTSERRQVVRAFRSAIIPRKRAGRKQSEALTAAYEAWKGGARGVVLFRTHIPRWDRLSRWRRTAEQRSLMDAIYSRNRRERAKQPKSAQPESG